MLSKTDCCLIAGPDFLFQTHSCTQVETPQTGSWSLVSNEDSHRGSHVCVCSSSQETTHPKSVMSKDPHLFTGVKRK